MKRLATVCYLGLGAGLLTLGSAAQADVQNCKIRFPNNSAEVNQQDLSRCLEQIRAGQVEYVFVVTSATPPGSTDYNRELTERRAANIRAAVGDEVPNAKVETLAAGENPQLGRSATMVIATSEEEGQEAARDVALRTSPGTDLGVSSAAQPDDKSWRAAIRVGQDNYRPEGNIYSSAGVEAAWIRNKSFFDNARLEVGGAINGLNSANLLDAYALHAFAGPGFNVGRFVVGGRALVGTVWDQARKWRLDSGLDARAGFETDTFSVFAGIGQTRAFTRLGMDVGVFF